MLSRTMAWGYGDWAGESRYHVTLWATLRMSHYSKFFSIRLDSAWPAYLGPRNEGLPGHVTMVTLCPEAAQGPAKAQLGCPPSLAPPRQREASGVPIKGAVDAWSPRHAGPATPFSVQFLSRALPLDATRPHAPPVILTTIMTAASEWPRKWLPLPGKPVA